MLSAPYVQTNLVSNVEGMALITDPELVNPWGVNFPQLPGINPPVVVADQGTGVATSYQISSDGGTVMESSSPVTIPTVGSSKPSGPTGVVQNTNKNEFLIPGTQIPATYIFDTLQGTIVGSYANGTTTSAMIAVNNSTAGAEYTGLAVGTVDTFASQDFIYAANEGKNPGIQVFNDSFQQVPLGPRPIGVPTFGYFIDPHLPAGFIPYGVRDISLGASGNKADADLFVTYRSPNFRGGAIAVFTNDGTFLGQIASDKKEAGALQSPWGLAFIKHSFGEFSDDLLVGNFSSGQIDAYTVTVVNPEPGISGMASAVLDGKVLNGDGLAPLTIPGLRSIHFGPGLPDSGRPDHTHVALLFTAETDTIKAGVDRNLSLYGEITPNKVNLLTGMATSTGGISNIQLVNGNGQGHVLVGNGSGVPPVETAGENSIIGGADGGAMLGCGSGQDIVIAGQGADSLIGGPNGDILIGDYTDYDTNIAALVDNGVI
jgi:uncharacterized protein (TIGR03118 family)